MGKSPVWPHEEEGEGSFPGHIIPGTFLLLLGVWWTCSACVQYALKQKAHKPFHARSWYPWPFWPTIQLESYCKVVFTLIGIAIELLWGQQGLPRPLFGKDGHFLELAINNYQHAAMYLTFCISGCVDILEQKYKRCPKGLSQVFLAQAFLVESLLMGFHLKGAMLDRMTHLLLVYSMAACFVGTLLEMWLPRSFLVSLLRPAAMVLQGTWFFQAAFVLYADQPAWDPTRHGGEMFLPVVFCYHIMGIGVGVLSVYLVADWLVHRNATGTIPHFALDDYSDDTEDEGLELLKETGAHPMELQMMSNKRSPGGDRSPFDI